MEPSLWICVGREAGRYLVYLHCEPWRRSPGLTLRAGVEETAMLGVAVSGGGAVPVLKVLYLYPELNASVLETT